MAANDPSGSALGVYGEKAANRNLLLRVASALVLAPVALGVAYYGGWPFVVFWTIAALGMQWEWMGLIGGPGRQRTAIAGAAALAIAGLLAGSGYFAGALIAVAAGVMAAALVGSSEWRAWSAAGILYAAALLIPAILLRRDPQFGFLVIILLFGIVWATDIVAYFVGRSVGGPKLWPRVSPNKTWSGAFGGTAAAILVALLIAQLGGSFSIAVVACIALLLSAVSQGGDLFESAVKRHFGAKDAGGLIPGHGGLMDRLDGFVFATCAAAIIGVARGGFDAAGRGLLIW